MGYIYLKENQTKLVGVNRINTLLTPKSKKILAGLFFVLGTILFSSALLPIIQFQLSYSVKFNQILNPLSSKFYSPNGGILGDVSADYTQLSNWFTSTNTQGGTATILTETSTNKYKISIPILKIKDAVVEVGSMDLKKSLIQYPQTALPGQLGNGVIFGHSVLPQFFNPKSYLTIFSTLYRLKQGDEIYVDYDNIRYKYLVEEMYEVTPTDLSVLEQRYDGRYLNLITCSPPGTYLRRLVVKARIVDI